MRMLILVLMLGVAATAVSEDVKEEIKGDAKAGADKIAVCAGCHGEGGIEPTAPVYPRLAGQTGEYLVSSMLAYRAGQRQGGNAAMMSPMAATLSDQDIADIAAYYSQVGASAEAGSKSK